MREFESCVGVCSVRKLELVGGGEYDELTVAAAARRARIQAFGTVVDELVATEPGRGEWRVAYEPLRQSARSLQRAQAVLDVEVEGALVGLLSRVAFVTPRHGQWERNWLALQSQARLLSRSAWSRHDATDGAIGEPPADG